MQYTQRRVANMAIDLYALTACISRTTRAIEKRGEEGARREDRPPHVFARAARLLVAENVTEFDENDDELRKVIAAKTCADGSYPLDILLERSEIAAGREPLTGVLGERSELGGGEDRLHRLRDVLRSAAVRRVLSFVLEPVERVDEGDEDGLRLLRVGLRERQERLPCFVNAALATPSPRFVMLQPENRVGMDIVTTSTRGTMRRPSGVTSRTRAASPRTVTRTPEDRTSFTRAPRVVSMTRLPMRSSRVEVDRGGRDEVERLERALAAREPREDAGVRALVVEPARHRAPAARARQSVEAVPVRRLAGADEGVRRVGPDLGAVGPTDTFPTPEGTRPRGSPCR